MKTTATEKASFDIALHYGSETIDTSGLTGRNNIPRGDKNFLRDTGWLSIWAKEITGVNSKNLNGAGLLGNWLRVDKQVKFGGHTPSADYLIPNSIKFEVPLYSSSENIVVCVRLDGTELVFILNRRHRDRIGSGERLQMAFSKADVTIPFPCDIPYRGNVMELKGAKNPFAKFFHNAAMAVRVSIQSDDWNVVMCLVSKQGGTDIVPPMSDIQDLYVRDLGQEDTLSLAHVMKKAKPMAGAVGFLDWALTNGILLGKGKPMNQKVSQETAFEAPDYPIPDAPAGYEWALNVRGLLLLRDKSGELFWPYEVFSVLNGAPRELGELITRQQKKVDAVLSRFNFFMKYDMGIGDEEDYGE